jgi:GntR family transcriptional regulator/MocR family aminotransferase
VPFWIYDAAMKRALPTSRALAREIRLVARPGDDAPLYQRLYRQLRGHILSGHLAPGARLPSARTLAADLGISRNTVEASVAQLVDEGYVVRRVGAGTVVASSLARESTPAAASGGRDAPVRLSRRGALLSSLGAGELRRDADTGPWATNLDRFPLGEWTRLLARRSRRAGRELLGSGDAQGLGELRREIASHATLSRGLRCSADRILVVAGTQEAMDLTARVALDPGEQVVVEEPGYLSSRAAFTAAGAKLVMVPVDGDGLVTRRLPRRGRVRLACVTPSHQFPLGVPLSLARRLELLRWAAARDAWVVEDDYDSEFRYDGRPLAALQSLDTEGRVIYVGTFNKVLFPGLRLAYLVLPAGWVPAFVAARRLAGGTSSPLLQSALAEFMATGRYAAYLRQGRVFYAGCRDRLRACVARDWGDRVRLGPSSTGLHLVAHLPEGSNDTELSRLARRQGLSALPLSRYYGDAKRPGLVISYGAADPDRIAAAISALARHVRRLAG